MGGFEFVLVNDTNRHEKVREHLRQRQSALRRSKAKELKEASAALKSNSILANGLLAFRHKDSPEDISESSGEDGQSQRLSTLSLARASSNSLDRRSGQFARLKITPVFEHAPRPLHASSEVVQTGHPLSILGATRSDPFRTYPIPGHREVDELFDFYVHDLGPRIFQYTSNANYDLFRCHASISLSDPAAFHALMIMAAINRDRLAGRSLPGVRALYHRVEAIKLINERLDSGDPGLRLSESTIYTIIRLEVLEKQWNAVGESEIHMPGLQQLLIQKGGIDVLTLQHPSLELMLYVTAVVIPRMLQAGSPALYNSCNHQVDEHQEETALSETLITFLTSVSASLEYNSRLFSHLRFAIGPGRAMHELLASPPPISSSYSAGLPTKAFSMIAERLRMGILLYIHCILLSSTTQKHFAELLDHMLWVNSSEWIWRRSLRMLHYLLVKDKEQTRLSDSATAWHVFRLGSATCLLTPATNDMVQRFLLDILSGRKDSSLDIDRIRFELAERHAFGRQR